jgi:hypothetical protein
MAKTSVQHSTHYFNVQHIDSTRVLCATFSVIDNEGEKSKEQQHSTHYFKFVVFMLLFLLSKPLLDYSQKA